MPFKKGQNGHQGQHVYPAKTKLKNAVVRALLRDFSEHGEKVIARLREENPAAYMRAIISMLPRDMNIEATVDRAMDVRNLPP